MILTCSLSAYWLGGSPQTFYKYYTAKAVVLYGSRFYLYKSKNWHYYMLEFCYFANILLLLEVWVFPQSPTFHKVWQFDPCHIPVQKIHACMLSKSIRTVHFDMTLQLMIANYTF